MRKRTILIVEDDPKLRLGLKDNLEFEGYQVAEAWNASLGSDKWFETLPDLVLLDLMLPGRNGFQLLKEMRGRGFETPVIILSARGEEWDKVKGFRLGCDDYVVKPFSIIELLERVRAVLRRAPEQEMSGTKVTFAGISLDVENRSVEAGGRVLKLKAREYDLLRYLMENPYRVISRREILRNVWMSVEEVQTRSIDVCISAIRKQIANSGCKIETVYKVGYRMVETEQ